MHYVPYACCVVLFLTNGLLIHQNTKLKNTITRMTDWAQRFQRREV